MIHVLLIICSEIYGQNRITSHPLGSLSIDSANNNIETAFGNKLDEINLVGLGEVSHGDKTTFAFNVKMVQYLVTNKNFKILLLEAPNSIVSIINEFISNSANYSNADIDSLVKRNIPYGPFHDEETSGLIKWLKDYNDQHPNSKVSIMGMNIDAKSPEILLNDYIKPYDQASFSVLTEKWKKPNYELFYKWSDVFNWEVENRDLINKLNDSTKEQIEGDIREAETTLEYFYRLTEIPKKDGSYVIFGNAGPLTVPDDNYFLQNYLHPGYDKYFTTNLRKLDSLREYSMASYILKEAKISKSIVWAHNDHILKPAGDKRSHLIMGDYLNLSLGRKYFNIISDYSEEAVVLTYDQKGIKKEPNAQAGSPTVKVLKKQFSFSEGIILSDELEKAGFKKIIIHTIDVHGGVFLYEVPIDGFDAIIVFNTLAPRALIK